MADKMTMAEWESNELMENRMFIDYSPNKQLTRDEVEQAIVENGTMVVIRDEREKYLRSVGLEVTRENIMNVNAQPPADNEGDES